MRRLVLFLAILALIQGCALVERPQTPPGNAEPPQETPAPEEPQIAPPPATARTPDQFDTTTDAQRAQAVADATPGTGDRLLGRTVASLGAAAEPGFWLKTPLVDAPAQGRVDYPGKGTSVAVELRPLEGAPGGGGQLSLSAMRLLGADLTSLPEVEVFLVSN